MRQKKLTPSAIAGILLGSVALVGCSTTTATSTPTVSSVMTSTPTYTSSEGNAAGNTAGNSEGSHAGGAEHTSAGSSSSVISSEVNPAPSKEVESSATALDVAKQNTLLYDFNAENKAAAESTISLFNV